MFLKNRNIISKIKRSKVTDYAALMICLIDIIDTTIDKMCDCDCQKFEFLSKLIGCEAQEGAD